MMSEGEREQFLNFNHHTSQVHLLFFFSMETLSRDVMIGMLRKGQTAEQIMEILNVIVPDNNSVNETEEVNVNEAVAA